MTQTSNTSSTHVIELSKDSTIKKTHVNSTGELVVKGVATAVAATAIIEAVTKYGELYETCAR